MPVPQQKKAASVQRVLLRDVALDQLKSAILDGTLEPGETLHIEELQNWLGISRTPIREAINELHRMGLIDLEPNRYTRVAEPVESEVLDAMHALGALLGGTVRLAVPRLPDEAAELVKERALSAAEGFRTRDAERVRENGFPTLSIYVEHCGNPLLIKVFRDQLDGLMHKVRAERLFKFFDTDALADCVEELAAATADRDPLRARNAIEGIFQMSVTSIGDAA